MTRPTRDDWAMEVARACAKRSTCLRRSVGCVLLDVRGHILSTGYNGVAAGLPHCNDPEDLPVGDHDGYLPLVLHHRLTSYPHACPGATSPSGTNLDGCGAIHAEQNALLQCQNVWEIDSCYCTTAPCITCTKLLLNTSCRRIIFAEDYPHSQTSKVMWENAGRSWWAQHRQPQEKG